MNTQTKLQQYLTGHDTSVLEERLELTPDLGFNYKIHSEESLYFLKTPSLQSVKLITETKTEKVTKYYINIFQKNGGYIAFIGEMHGLESSIIKTNLYESEY